MKIFNEINRALAAKTKFFLIPLMTLMCSVMAWGTVRTAGTYQELLDALTAAANGDEIQLTADIEYPASPTVTDLINIDKSITLDGKGHGITGYGYCNYRLDTKAVYQPTSIAVNANHDKSGLNVTIKNLKLIDVANSYTTINGTGDAAVPGHSSNSRYYGISAFDGVNSLTLDGMTIKNSKPSNHQLICVQGSSTTPLNLTINNSEIGRPGKSYPTYILKPVNLTMNNSQVYGYCALYFKGPQEGILAGNAGREIWYGTANAGARGSVVVANGCDLSTKTTSGGTTNSFGIMALEDDGISITLNNCLINAEQIADAIQVLLYMEGYQNLDRRSEDIILTINGSNTTINGSATNVVNNKLYKHVENGDEQGLHENGWNSRTSKAEDKLPAYTADVQVIMTGGTYNFNPDEYEYNMHVSTADPHYADGAAAPTVFTKKGITIPAGYSVESFTQGGKTLYRIVEDIDVSYDINEKYETGDEGENPHTNFIVQETTTLDNNATEANYVQVRENAGNAATLTVGKTGVDQTLTVTNGIDVQDDATVIVKSGSALVVENGGVITAKPENIVIEANENGAASLLLSPAVTVNQTPNLTVKMKAKQIGADTDGKYHWHRFAMPVAAGITSWQKEGTSALTNTYPTYLYGWDYVNNQWLKLTNGVEDMVPLMGYTLTLASDEIEGWAGALEDVTYIFKGNLVGNTNQALNFQAEGFNFFGNSYTGYMDVLTLIQGLESNNVEGTVYMWCNDPDAEEYQSYVGVSLYRLQNLPITLASWQKEVAPMQTFILRLRGADSANEEVDYASAIWGNPRYGHPTPTSAPRRLAAALNDNTYMEIVVKGANGKGDCIDFAEDANHTDSFESGYDVVKYMNENRINLYTTLANENFSSVVTDNVLGKTINIQTTSDINYTMTFKNLSGNEYAIRDNATGKVINMEEGASYEFSAQPNSTVEGRFEIVNVNKAPTAIENTEVKANVKGIYTLMGQYVGEDFNTLPAGVYVVDGVKIVK